MDQLSNSFRTLKKPSMIRITGNCSGFSLIELLAVIVVIAILSAILIPVVGVAKTSARKTKSLSNLRQLAAGIQMYSSDNEGFYPIGYFDTNPSDGDGNPIETVYGSNPPFAGERYWYQEISPYIDQLSNSESVDFSILVSPFDENVAGANPGEIHCSYSVNGHICADISIDDDRLPAWNLTGNKSEIILVGEGVTNSSGIAMAVFETPANPWIPGSVTSASLDTVIGNTSESDLGALSYRANGDTLVAFLDGHTEALERGTVRYKNVLARP